MQPPAQPKIYHIVHVDRLKSICSDGYLWCDAEVFRSKPPGTMIGMSSIKHRRLHENVLASHPDLRVGDCVPFYFCPRSIMLYLLHCRNHPELEFRGGQTSIVHLQADLHAAVDWANENGRRWAFTLSNAGSKYFEDRSDLARLDEIDWAAVHAEQWAGNNVSPTLKEGKQAEFLMEFQFPWQLVERIGVGNRANYDEVLKSIPKGHLPTVEILPEWYY